MLTLIIVAIATLIGILVLRAKNMLTSPIGLAIVTVMCAATIILSAITAVSFRHGMYRPNMSIPDMVDAIAKTPEQSNISSTDELEDGQLVIVYRFDCSDCHAVYEELLAWLGRNDIEPVWISSRSEIGQQLVKDLSIGAVPHTIRWSDSDNTPAHVTIYERITQEDGSEKTVLDVHALESLQ